MDYCSLSTNFVPSEAVAGTIKPRQIHVLSPVSNCEYPAHSYDVKQESWGSRAYTSRAAARRLPNVVAYSAATLDPLSSPSPAAELLSSMDSLARETGFLNWDDERGLPIPAGVWAAAKSVVIRVSRLPYVSVSGDGFVHLTWIRPGERMVAEIGTISWVTTMSDGAEPKIEQVEAGLVAAKVLSWVSQR